MKASIIETERLVLKPLSLDHLTQQYVDWLNDKEVYKYLETGGDYTIELLSDYLTDVVNKDIYFWAIHLKNNNTHIGNIKIDPVNTRHNFAEYGIMMGEKGEWGKGYAKEASKEVISHCFKNLNIRKINLGVVAENEVAYHMYKKLGFAVEGILKAHGMYFGKYCDIIRMALFNSNYSKYEK